MPVTVQVGMLSGLKKHDPEGYELRLRDFEFVNKLLTARRLPTHREPEDTPTWNAVLESPACLTRLRSFAAAIDAGVELPAPAPIDTFVYDPVLDSYGHDSEGPDAFEKLFGDSSVTGYQPAERFSFQRGFDHLILHSEHWGYYVPQHFLPRPPRNFVGSAPRLLAECERLAGILEIPEHLTPSSSELVEAAYGAGSSAAQWQRYGIESYVCVVLRTACRLSLEWGASVEFTHGPPLPI